MPRFVRMVPAVPEGWDVQLTSYWWDLFQEEFEEQTIARAVNIDMDSPYIHASGESRVGPPFMYAKALEAYSVAEADATSRAARYCK